MHFISNDEKNNLKRKMSFILELWFDKWLGEVKKFLFTEIAPK